MRRLLTTLVLLAASVLAEAAPNITTGALTGAVVGSAYSFTMAASGGTPPYAWSISSNNPNSGMWLTVSGAGVLSGTPQMPETEAVVLMVTDATGSSSQQSFNLAVTNSGALAIVSGSTLPAGTVGGAYYYQFIAQGGSPPYSWAMSAITGTTNWNMTYDGWALGMPTAAETDTFTATVTDMAGNTATLFPSVTHNTTLRIVTADPTTGLVNLPPARAGHNYKFTFRNAVAGGTAPYTYAISSGALPTGLTMTSGGVITGVPTKSGNPTATLRVTDNVAATATAPIQMTVLSTSTAVRPGYNTGSGYFVSGTTLYDPNGYEYRIRGLDRNHYDSISWAGPANGGITQANAVRYFLFRTDGTVPVSTYTSRITSEHTANNELAIPTMSLFPDNTGTTGNSSTTEMATGVNWWVANESAWAPLMNSIGINVANEWGPSNSTVWQYAYQAVNSNITAITQAASAVVTVNSSAVTNPFANSSFAAVFNAGGMTAINTQVVPITATGGVQGAWTVTLSINSGGFAAYTSGGTLYAGAVGILRAAGYLCPIFIDTGGSGQNEADFTNFASSVFNSDPQLNTIFSYHLYGGTTPSNTITQGTAPIAGITKASSAVVTLAVVGGTHHPFQTAFPANTFWGTPNIVIHDVNGMTQINGTDAIGSNPLGGSSGAWTVTTQVNSTGFSTYTSGGMLDDSRWYPHVIARLAALNVPMIIGEFGPGQLIGASPTNVSINNVISSAEANGLGWIYWAWDDHTGSPAFSGWYGCTLNNNGAYSVPVDLTAPGMEAVLHPRYGLATLAMPISGGTGGGGSTPGTGTVGRKTSNFFLTQNSHVR